MDVEHDLTLPEEVLLLALRDDAGTIPMGSMYSYAIAGAVIAELALRGRITVQKVKKSNVVQLVDQRPTGDPLLDEAQAQIQKAKRRASVVSWVGRLAQEKSRDRVAHRLVQRGILRKAEGRVLVFFSRNTWPTVNPAPEAQLVEQMRRAIFHGETPDPHIAILIGISSPSGLLDNVFEKRELKERKDRIEEIAATAHPADVTGQAVKVAIEAAVAAVMTATMAATAATTASA
jgi:golgi phosphoprotein 3